MNIHTVNALLFQWGKMTVRSKVCTYKNQSLGSTKLTHKHKNALDPINRLMCFRKIMIWGY